MNGGGGGQANTTNTTENFQLNENSTGDVAGNKTSLAVAGSDNNTISYTATTTDLGAVKAGETLGLAALENGSKALDTTAKTFSEFASQLSKSQDKSITAVQAASASQSQQGNETFKQLFGILALSGVAATFLLKKK